MLVRCFLDFSVGVGAFVLGLSQISSFFFLDYGMYCFAHFLYTSSNRYLYIHRTKESDIFSLTILKTFLVFIEFVYVGQKKIVTKWISHPVFYGDLACKLRRVKISNNFISSDTKIVKHLRHRSMTDGSKKTIGLVIGPSKSPNGLLHSSNKAVGTSSKPPQRQQGL